MVITVEKESLRRKHRSCELRVREGAKTMRRVKTGCLPEDDTHRLTLTMTDRRSLVVTVLAQPSVSDGTSVPAPELVSFDPGTLGAVLPELLSPGVTRWENEGGGPRCSR